MRDAYIRSAIRAEVRRARRDGREVNRLQLRDETGLAWHRLEFMIAEASRDLASAPPPAGGQRQEAGRPGEGRDPNLGPGRRRSGP